MIHQIKYVTIQDIIDYYIAKLEFDLSGFTNKQRSEFDLRVHLNLQGYKEFLEEKKFSSVEDINSSNDFSTMSFLFDYSVRSAFNGASNLSSIKDPPTNTRQQIGQVWVDSGQVMIVDPCYLSSWDTSENDYSATYNDGEGPFGFSYNGACNATLSYKHAAQLEHGAVASSTAYGDGSYPVFATYNNEGRIEKLEILFDWDEEEEYEEEEKEEDSAFFEMLLLNSLSPPQDDTNG